MSTPARIPRHIQFAGQYEPEGIHLTMPVDSETALLLQGWGDNPEYHGRFTYNGIRLKGHPGIDLAAPAGTDIRACDSGRIIEISNEAGGLGRSIKIEHRWGESLYAQIGEILVETGQVVERGQPIGRADRVRRAFATHLHFAIRVHPYNRFDGWGGFSDPTPFLYGTDLLTVDAENDGQAEQAHSHFLPPMIEESPGLRRP